ncbi:MBL fold metallo-hydrolase [Variovorax sp. LjRoot130]|uniref:MBL fold metallo-hydrolase n=1 Tax=Variovorax sp. LjRoot130 TaxID=3342261 RepID=UPI003ECD8AC8
MVRPTQQLHPPREPAPPLAAATVLLLRDTPEGIEVLMTRRSASASFAPGAYVFPGGRIDEGDRAAHRIALRRPTQSEQQLTQAVAAVRESFEELGVLLARHEDGRPVSADEVAAMDRSTAASAIALADQCATRGLRLATDELFTFAHWITDRDLPKRFDVPFLVARMPEGQTPTADETEQFEPCWVRPADALARHKAGGFLMIFPTVRTLERMAAYDSVDALLDACAHRADGEGPLFTSCPRAGLLRGQEARYMEHDSPYGELALVCPDGQIVHALDWQSEALVPLLKNVQRLTAPNPGAMTGPGTNSYIVGDAASGYIVIDPGPNDAGHIERLHRATGDDIRMIVCTHSHADHSPGAAPLQALCAASKPAILGLPSAPTARASARFAPDRTLQDQERLVLHGLDGTTHTLRAVHTPGHAANHLCLVLEEDGLLFSGDHVLNGSTTVVDPPDGNMNAYLDSLDRLDALCAEGEVRFILPAHGYVLGEARAAIAYLKAHRLKREAKIAAAMQRLPQGTPEDWLPLAYDDVPERMWPVAARSLAAHVERIRQLAQAR